MTWYVVRHANKEKGNFYNERLRHQDQPISSEGREAAGRLASFFADKPIAAMYVSGYLRTSQTAAAVAERLQLKPVIDERLNEIDNGPLDSMSEEEFRKAYPQEYAAYSSRTADFRFPDGETGQEVRERIISFVEEKRPQHAGEDVLIIAHDGLIRTWMCWLMELPVYRRGDFQVDYCGIMELAYQEEYSRWKLVRFNQTCCG